MDIESLLRSLKGNKVRFVIIGAAAFPVHGYARATLDIDFFIERTATNALRCYKALQNFGYDLHDVKPGEFLRKKILLRHYAVEADFHPSVSGVRFPTVWKHRVKGRIGETTVDFASLDDLIQMKKAAGRAKDKQDLRVLLGLKKRPTARFR